MMRPIAVGLTLVLGLAVSDAHASSHEEQLAALTDGYLKARDPIFLLAIARLYEQKFGGCKEALDAYRRFFEACGDCDDHEIAVNRYRNAIDRCVAEPATAISVPRADFQSLHATRAEIAELLSRLSVIDRRFVSRMTVEFLEAGRSATVAQLNAMRARIWQRIAHVPAEYAEVVKLADRLTKVDPETAERAFTELETLRKTPNQVGLNTLRATLNAAVMKHLAEGAHLKPGSQPAVCGLVMGQGFGDITINTVPWSEVHVNGRHVGSTPISKLRVPGGCANVRAVNPATKQEVEIQVDVEVGETRIYQFRVE